ncbi:MAG: hypothetical protein GY788_07565 [bacterium]|nr:hypothetical protein [bacterium]
MKKMTVLVLALIVLTGCAGDEISRLVASAEEQLVIKNDFKLNASRGILCSSSLSAVHRAYGGDPEVLGAMLRFCGWGQQDMGGIIRRRP